MKAAAGFLALGLASALPAATFTVTGSADSGAGSLRQALLDANAAPGIDTIAFAIPGGGVSTISPLTPLPALSEDVVIDGATQPGFSVTPLIELDGTLAGPGAYGLDLASGNSTVRALAIGGFGAAGIRLGGSGGSAVEGCHVGLDASGMLLRGNGQTGILVVSGAHRVGGNTPAHRNVIAGQPIGIELLSPEPGSVVLGNYVGTLADGSTGVGSSLGISVESPSVALGGGAPGLGNLVSGHQGDAIHIEPVGSGTLIRGNRIGTDASGQHAVSNSANGISIAGADGILVGGAGPGEGNLISGNGGRAVSISGTGNVVLGNSIGTDAAGAAPLPNAIGVALGAGGDGNTIGGVAPGEGNLIAFNHGPGVSVVTGSGNAIRGNIIFENGGQAIDLVAPDAVPGPTPNDAGDLDDGGNRLQNFPLITSVEASPGALRIQGTLTPGSEGDYTLDFYADAACLPRTRGYLQAGSYLGAAVVTSEPDVPSHHGDIVFDVTLPKDLPPGELVTATATDAAGNTSELFAGIVFDVSPRSGRPDGGEAFVVHGTDFAEDAVVFVAGVPVSAVVIDETAIAAVSPTLAPGTVADVTVESSEGPDGGRAYAWVADFLDVPPAHPFHDAVVTLVSNGVAAGCGAGFFCVDAPVTRAQAAPLLLRARDGVCEAPPACSGVFADVPCPSLFADWVEELAAEGISAGCGGGAFCPDAPLRRDQIAALLLKARFGAAHVPPPCTGLFDDVPCPSPFADWIEQLVLEGIAAGCGAGSYCPDAAVARGHAAALIAKTFALP